MFNMDEKIYLFDLTNTYFEGRMENSDGRGRDRELYLPKKQTLKTSLLIQISPQCGLRT